MTLDQSLANLQHQADRLAAIFSATSDAIEAGSALAPPRQAVKAARDIAAAFPAPVEAPQWPTAHPDAAVQQLAAASQTPQGASLSSTQTTAAPTAGAVEVEGPGAATPETPRPAAPVAEAPPWVTQAETTAAEAPAKKGGRRTNEELAAELGISLDEVKAWKGGGRISKADMEEFKRLNPETTAVIHPQSVADDFAPEPTQQWAPAPDRAGVQVAAAQEWPIEGQTLDQAANPAQGAPQEWPAVGQPVTPPPAGEQFGDWPTAEGGFNPSNPFGG